MKHINYLDEEPIAVTEAGAEGVSLRWAIGEKDGAENFFMRIVTFEPGGKSPSHSHDYEHEFYVISGRGTAEVESKTVALKTGDVLFIPPNAHHCFRTDEAMEVICLIPKK